MSNKIKLGEGQIIDQKTGEVIAKTHGGTVDFARVQKANNRHHKQQRFISAMIRSGKYIGTVLGTSAYIIFTLNFIGWLIGIGLGFLAFIVFIISFWFSAAVALYAWENC